MKKENLLNKYVEVKRSNGIIKMGKKYLVIGYFIEEEEVVLFHHSINGHSGTTGDRLIYLEKYNTLNKRKGSCWNVGLNEIYPAEDFKNIFNKLERDDNECTN